MTIQRMEDVGNGRDLERNIVASVRAEQVARWRDVGMLEQSS
jgi:hypothetical protein